MKQLLKKILFKALYFRKRTDIEAVYAGEKVSPEFDFDVAAVIASDGRQEILCRVVERILCARSHDLSVLVVIAVSSQSDFEFLESRSEIAKFIVIARVPNFPLGSKWQSAVDVARSYSPKNILITGSDDIIDEPYILEGLRLLNSQNGIDSVGTSNWIVCDARKSFYKIRLREGSKTKSLGAGRMYSARLLNKFDWKLFEPNFNSGLDILGQKLANKFSKNGMHINNSKGVVLSVKGEWSMLNSLDSLTKSDKFLVNEINPSSKEVSELSRLVS